MTPTLTLVVRALNEAAHLGTLLQAAKSQTCPPDQIILVDSGSTDRTVEIAESFGAEIVHIAPEEFSFGRSLNVGCQHARGDVLVFASAHVYPTDDRWLERLTRPFEDRAVALSYGGQVGDHRTKFSEQQLLRRWFPDRSDNDQDHPFCNNANCAVRRAVWQAQPYDEQLTGLEDVHWAHQALKAGHRLVYVAPARVVHVHEEGFSQLVNRYRREAIAHRRIFEEQSMNALEALGLFVANVVRDLGAALAQRRPVTDYAGVITFRAAQFYGTWRGFNQQGEVTGALKRRFYYPNSIQRAIRGDADHGRHA